MNSAKLLLFTLAVTATSVFASPSEEPVTSSKNLGGSGESDVPARYSFLECVNDFASDSILHPVDPFVLVPGKDPNAWQFVIEPYMWLSGISGSSGVGGLPPMDINVSARNLLQNLNWGIMSRGEVRKGRWGLLADGYYASLSASGDIEDALYQSGALDVQQAFASLAVAYRIIDDRRGFLDLYSGARYNYLGIQVDMSVNTGAVDSLSKEMTDRLQQGISARVSDLVSSRSGMVADDLEKLARGYLTSRALQKIAGTPEGIRNLVRDSRLRRILSVRNAALAGYIRAEAELQVAQAKGAATAEQQSKVNAAKAKLSKKIASEIESALPTHGAGAEWWVDPIIGLRGRVNFTRWLYFATLCDVGGFGVGSQITWNLQATFGINFTRNVFAELGYRYMYVDYNKNDFLYNMNTYGIYSSFGVKF